MGFSPQRQTGQVAACWRFSLAMSVPEMSHTEVFCSEKLSDLSQRNSESNGKAPAGSALWHWYPSSTEGEKVILHLLPDASLHNSIKYEIQFIF